MALPLSFTVILLALAYAGLMVVYAQGWRGLPEWRLPPGFVAATRVTVIIPARNEAANIGACLNAILNGDYPLELLEIVVVDDHSDDATPEIVKALQSRFAQLRLVALADFINEADQTKAYKKQAIDQGIGQASGEIMVTTDADCLAGPQWISLIVAVFQAQPEVKIITAPVLFHREMTLFQRFQALDFLGLMGITGAGIYYRFQHMGNGANLAFRKTLFAELGGYAGNDHQASGDDMFLIQKVAARYPRGVFFLKNTAATVFTEAMPDLRSFLQQRLRWGTKNAALPEWPIRLALAAVFLFCWSIVINLLALPFIPMAWPLALFQILIKATADFLFLALLCRYFDCRELLRVFWPSFFLHTLYIALVGAASLVFKKFDWKGRRVR
ncbi:MAG: glycosyltransferase [Saprospiraceae bacterium]